MFEDALPTAYPNFRQGSSLGMIRLLCLDLHHEIAISNIRDVTETGKWFGYGTVELHFETVEGEDKRILIYMKQYRDFIDKVTNAMHQ